ncbi:hypothetical protein Smic_30870 [Streptomyces microflavus]|uniref:Uncharacterized protein n=1 Tax=Streptomyces microflavus TaxID=1919 RepID=A0A7J0CPV7_STRMI|nr:hypothetical protein Smic_30870 [Streptomyces microflavus]
MGGGFGEHLRGGVVAGDARLRPTVGEEGGDVSGAAAEVGDAGRGVAGEVADPGQEVLEGAGAVVRVAQVLLGIPGGVVRGRCHGKQDHARNILMSRHLNSRDFMSTDPLH